MIENKFITRDYFINDYLGLDTLEDSKYKGKNKDIDYYIQFASDEVNDLSVINLRDTDVLENIAPYYLNGIQRATAFITEYYMVNGTNFNRGKTTTELGNFKGEKEQNASDLRTSTYYEKAKALMESVGLHFSEITPELLAFLEEEFDAFAPVITQKYIKEFEGSNNLNPNLFSTIDIDGVLYVTIDSTFVQQFGDGSALGDMDKPINTASDLPFVPIVVVNQGRPRTITATDVQGAIEEIDALLTPLVAQVPINTADIVNLKATTLLNTNKNIQQDNRLTVLEDSVLLQLLFQQKISTNPVFNLTDGIHGLDLSNGTNWTAPTVDDTFQIINSTRTDQELNNIWGWEVKPAFDITQASIEVETNFWLEFGTITGLEKTSDIVVVQYPTQADFIAGTNGFTTVVRTIVIDSSLSNLIIKFSDVFNLLSADGLWIELHLVTAGGTIPAGLAGSDSDRTTTIKFVTSKASAVIGTNSGDTTDDSGARPFDGINPWRVDINTNTSNINQEIIDRKALIDESFITDLGTETNGSFVNQSVTVYSVIKLANGNFLSCGLDGVWNLVEPDGTPIDDGVLGGGSVDVFAVIELANGNWFFVGQLGSWFLTNSSGGFVDFGFLTNQSSNTNSIVQLSNGNIFCVGDIGKWNLIQDDGTAISNGTFTGQGQNVMNVIELSNNTLFSVGIGGRWNINSLTGSSIDNGTFVDQSVEMSSSIQLPNGNIFVVGADGKWNIVQVDGTAVDNGMVTDGALHLLTDLTLINNQNLFIVGTGGNWWEVKVDGTPIDTGVFINQIQTSFSTAQGVGHLITVGDGGRWNIFEDVSLDVTEIKGDAVYNGGKQYENSIATQQDIKDLLDALIPIGMIVIAPLDSPPTYGTWQNLGGLNNGETITGGGTEGTKIVGENLSHSHSFTHNKFGVNDGSNNVVQNTQTTGGETNTTTTTNGGSKNIPASIQLGTGIHIWKRIA